jgi:glycosyltransferase involved in cell wall biosynthesis
LIAHARARDVAERVHFTGALDPAQLPDVYASSDAFMFPSTTETQGLVLAEAMAAGLPVLAADVPVNREVLDGFGRLEPPDPERFAAGLAALLATPGAPADPLALERRFGRSAHAAGVLAAYREVLGPLAG